MKAHACHQRITPETLEKKYKATNPSLRSDSSSQDSVEIPPEQISKVLANKQNK